jgi:TonB-dependent starch-binding outer membrane protein SusC
MMMKKVYRSFLQLASLFLLLLLTIGAHAQSKAVTGSVTDEAGSPMPGVNVVVKGTTSGTTTNATGIYTISVADADVLQFSFIGFVTQEVRVGNLTKIDIKLVEDVATLQEVVVTGYGEMKRGDLATAQVTVNSEQIQKTVNTTFDQALQGRTAGVFVTQNSGQPGGAVSVNIRGINTISGSNEPLYVIDGIQTQSSSIQTGSYNNLAGINPNDIESFEVLQGPAATAIYGSRGTNGVIIITTKRGKAGEAKVNYTFNYALQDEPQQLDVLSLPEYAQMYSEIRVIQGGEPPVQFSNPSLLGPGTNWQDELFKTAPMQKHQLSVSGGNENTNYYISGEYFDQEGIAIGSNFRRYSTTLNVDNKIRPWFKLQNSLKFNTRKESVSATQNSVISTALSLSPDIPVKNPDGSWGGADAANGNPVQYTPLNPIAIANLTKDTRNVNEFLGSMDAHIDIYKGLSFHSNFAVTTSTTRSDYFLPTYRIGSRVNDVAVGSASTSNSTYWLWNQRLVYDKKFGKSNINIMATHEAQESIWKNVGGEKRGFVSNDIQDLNIGNDQGAVARGGSSEWALESYLGRVMYNWNDIVSVQATYRTDGSVNFGTNNKWGKFPSAAAAVRLTELDFLKDSNTINELKIRFETGLTGNPGGVSFYGPLYSSASPWGTGFFQGRYSNADLKWEETYTNNLGVNVGLFQNRLQVEGDVYIKKTDNLLLTAPLPDYLGTAGEGAIAPPQINIGSLENKGYAISILATPIDQPQGLKWETNVNVSGFRTKITEFYSETAFVDRSPWYVGDFGTGNSWTQRSAPGSAPWLFRGYVFDGIFQTVQEVQESARPVDNNGEPLAVAEGSIWVGDVKFKDLNNDGKITEDDKTNIGNPWPKAIFGWVNTLSYKNFTLSFIFQGVYGNDVFNFIRFNGTNPNNINLGRNMLQETFEYAKIEGSGSEAHLTNPGTEIPRISGNNTNGNRLRITDQYVEDGSYIRLKNVSLRYDFPRSIMSHTKVIRNSYILVGAQNLWTITGYKGYDPEVGAYVGPNSQGDNQSIGLDIGRYPLVPVYTFALGLEF